MYMQYAIKAAKKSGKEIPVGAVIVQEKEILAVTCNQIETDNVVTSHAEILALQAASKILNRRRLTDCELYVTLEPCPMCAWAILQAGIKRVCFGAYDLNYGALGSKLDLREVSNSKTQVCGGIMEQECRKLLEEYFHRLRSNKFNRFHPDEKDKSSH